MRCLLLNSDDNPTKDQVLRQRWDRVLDLGIAGETTYREWTQVLGCEVEPYPSLRDHDFSRLREVIAFGIGQVVDRQGMDWWDLTSVRWLDDFVQVLLVSKFLKSLRESDEVFVTSNRLADLIELLAPNQVRRINTGKRNSFTRRAASLGRLSFPQVLQILGDKYDGRYRLRRLLTHARPNCSRPTVLLPSGYGNASRTAVSYAAVLPDLDFLLMATRQSAWVDAPGNVARSHLASYVTWKSNDRELKDLLGAWEALQCRLESQPELATLRKLGCFGAFPRYLNEGLSIRDCWIEVFRSEPIFAVLSADEKNPYTRIPLLMARNRGLPTIACHHGALDGRYLFTDLCADHFLAKSAMEWDYAVDRCGMQADRVRIAEPAGEGLACAAKSRSSKSILFFSEPYEASNCRAHEVYKEVLLPLVHFARQHGCELVIKLHPFESVRHRRKLLGELIAPDSRNVVRFVDGTISEELMQQLWFSVTVSSSAAIDCARRGVPSFLCMWLDRYGFGYSDQFVKFGGALPLYRADQISDISSMFGQRAPAALGGDMSLSSASTVLRELLLNKSGQRGASLDEVTAASA